MAASPLGQYQLKHSHEHLNIVSNSCWAIIRITNDNWTGS